MTSPVGRVEFKAVSVHSQSVTLVTPSRTSIAGWSVGSQYGKSTWKFVFPDNCVIEAFGEISVNLAPASPSIMTDVNSENSTNLMWRDAVSTDLLEEHVLNERDDLVIRDEDGKVQSRWMISKEEFAGGMVMHPSQADFGFQKAQFMQSTREFQATAATDIKSVIQAKNAQDNKVLLGMYYSKCSAAVDIQSSLRSVMTKRHVSTQIQAWREEKVQTSKDKHLSAACTIQSIVRAKLSVDIFNASRSRAAAATEVQVSVKTLLAVRAYCGGKNTVLEQQEMLSAVSLVQAGVRGMSNRKDAKGRYNTSTMSAISDLQSGLEGMSFRIKTKQLHERQHAVLLAATQIHAGLNGMFARREYYIPQATLYLDELEVLQQQTSDLEVLREELKEAHDLNVRQKTGAIAVDQELRACQIEVKEALLKAVTEEERKELLATRMRLNEATVSAEVKQRQLESYMQEIQVSDQNYSTSVERLMRQIEDGKRATQSSNDMLLATTSNFDELLNKQYAEQAEMFDVHLGHLTVEMTSTVDTLENEISTKEEEITLFRNEVGDLKAKLANVQEADNSARQQLKMQLEESKQMQQQQALVFATSLQAKEDRIHTLEIENSSLRKEVPDLDSKLRAALDAVAQAQMEASIQSQKATSMEDKLMLHEFNPDGGAGLVNQHLQSQLDDQFKNAADLEVKLQTAQAEIANLMRSNENAARQSHYLEEECAKVHHESDQLRVEMEHLAKTNGAHLKVMFEADLTNTQSALESSQAEVASLQAALREFENNKEPTGAVSGKKGMEYMEQIRQMTAQLQLKEASQTALAEQCKTLNDLRVQETERADNLTSELEALQNGRTETRGHATKQFLRDEADNALKRTAELERTLGEVRLEREESKAEAIQLEILVSHIRQVSCNAPKTIQTLQDQISQYEELIRQLNTQVQELEVKAVELEITEHKRLALVQELEVANREVERLNIKAHELEMELASWRTNAMCDQMRSELDQERNLRINNDATAVRLEKCQVKLSDCVDRVKQADQALIVSQKQLRICDSQYQALRDEVHDVKQVNAELALKKIEAETEVTVVNQKLQALTVEMSVLQKSASFSVIEALRLEILDAHDLRCCGSEASALQDKRETAALEEAQTKLKTLSNNIQEKEIEFMDLKQATIEQEMKFNAERSELVAQMGRHQRNLETERSVCEHEREEANKARSQMQTLAQMAQDYIELKALFELERSRTHSLTEEVRLRQGSSVETFTERLSQLATSNAEMCSQLEQMSVLQATVSKLNAENEQLLQERSRHESNGKALKKQVSDLEVQCSLHAKTDSNKDGQVERFRQLVNVATSQVQSKTSDLEQSHSRCCDLESQLAQANVLLSTATEKVESWKREISLSHTHEYLMHIRSERDEFAEAANTHFEAEASLQLAQMELEELKPAVSEREQLKKDCSALQQRCAALQESSQLAQDKCADAVTLSEFCNRESVSNREQGESLLKENAAYRAAELALELRATEAEANQKYAELTANSLTRELQEWQDGHGLDGSLTAGLQQDLKDTQELLKQEQALSSQVNTIQAKYDITKISLTKMEAQLHAFEGQLQESKQEAIKSGLASNEAQASYAALQQASALLEASKKTAEESLDVLQVEFSGLKAAHLLTAESLEKLGQEKKQVEEAAKRAEKEIAILSQNNSDNQLTSELREENSKLHARSLEMAQDSTRADSLKAELEELKSRRAAEETADQVRVEFEAAQTKWNNENTKLEETLVETKSSEQSLADNLSAKSEELEAILQQLAESKDTNNANSVALADANCAIAAMNQEIAVFCEVQSAHTKDQESSNGVATQLRSDLDKALQSGEARVCEVADLYKEKLAVAELSVQAMKEVVSSKEEEIRSLKETLSAHGDASVADGEQKMANMVRCVKFLQESLDQEQQKQGALHEQVQTLTTDRDDLEHSKTQMTHQLESKSCSIASLTQELSVVRVELADTKLILEETTFGDLQELCSTIKLEGSMSKTSLLQSENSKVADECHRLTELCNAQMSNLESTIKNEGQLKLKLDKTLEYLHASTADLEETNTEFQKAFERAQSLETQLQVLQEDKLTREHQLRNEMDRERQQASHYEASMRKYSDQLASAEKELQSLQKQVTFCEDESFQCRAQIETLTTEIQQQEGAHLVQSASAVTLRFQVMRLQNERDGAVENETTLRVEIAKLRESGMFLEVELRELMGLDQIGDLRTQLKEQVQTQQRRLEVLQNQNALLNDESSAEKVIQLQQEVESLQDQSALHEGKVAEEQTRLVEQQARLAEQQAQLAEQQSQLAQAKEKFDAMDANGDGVIDRDEFAAAAPSTVDVGTEMDDLLELAVSDPDPDKLDRELQESIAEQLSGDMGRHGRARHEQASPMSDAGRYVLWKARYALEQARYAELLQDFEAMKLRCEGESLLVAQRSYDKHKIAACTQDFTELLKLGFVGVTGKDSFDIPVVVFAAKNLPKGIPFDRLIQFIIHVLDEVVANSYHIVYIHSEKGDDAAELDPAWMKRALDLLPFKYKRNIGRLFILHPDFWFKMFYMSNKSVLGEKTLDKVVYAENIEDLFSQLGRRSTVLPGYAYEHEGKLHDSREILVRAKKQSWNDAMKKEESAAKRNLLKRNLSTVDFLSTAKEKYVAEEMYADAELVKDEMAALYDEINSLQTDLGQYNHD